MAAPNRFRSKFQAMGSAKHFHACLDCRRSQEKTWKNCPHCNSTNRQHFRSERELRRGMYNLIRQDIGEITRLRFQTRFPLELNNEKLGTYVSDCDYYEGDIWVIEDTKPPFKIDKHAELKIKVFQAIYRLKIRIWDGKNAPNSSTPKLGENYDLITRTD